MSDLINRQAAIRDIRLMDVCVMYDDVCSIEEAVEKAIVATKRTAIFGLECMPSAKPRKRGKWIGKEKYMNSPEYFSWQCSVCGSVLEDPTLDKPYPFCPNCGADMREGEE